MLRDGQTPTAEIIRFRSAADQGNFFTTQDRIELLRWEARNRDSMRLEICRRHDGDPPEVGEYASIYPVDGPWAAWGAARQGRKINVWRARDGRDLGRFETMHEVLALVVGSATAPRHHGIIAATPALGAAREARHIRRSRP